MATAKAYDLDQAYQLLNSGKHREAELDFDIDTDAFFQIADEYGDKGAEIKRSNNHFVIRLEPLSIPSFN